MYVYLTLLYNPLSKVTLSTCVGQYAHFTQQ